MSTLVKFYKKVCICKKFDNKLYSYLTFWEHKAVICCKATDLTYSNKSRYSHLLKIQCPQNAYLTYTFHKQNNLKNLFFRILEIGGLIKKTNSIELSVIKIH